MVLSSNTRRSPNPTIAVIDSSIFKAYGIRGIISKNLGADGVRGVGRAVASEAKTLGQKMVVIGRDGCRSGPEFDKAFAKGMQAAGFDVINLSMVATPTVYSAAIELSMQCGVTVAGSYNPPDYEGSKMVVAGDAIYEDRYALRSRQNFSVPTR